MAYHKVLAALDKSSQGKDVFEEAFNIAQTQNAELLLLFCLPRWEKAPISPPASVTTGMGLDPMMGMSSYSTETEMLQATDQEVKRAIEDTEAWLQQYQKKAENKGVITQSQCIPTTENPGQKICTVAKEWNADLAVVGRTGRRGLEEAFLGSVSNYVVHHASCSVLVVQGNN